MPAPEPIPNLPPARTPNSVALGDPKKFKEVKLTFPIAEGPYGPTWESIAQSYPAKELAWLRDAKFGFWVHFGPQASGQSGDWYARRMYIQGELAYQNHLRDFGHPSEVGYKDLLKDWNPKKLDPKALVQTYHDAGARFLLIQGVHHDNFDSWDSAYQPWNSVNMGPRRDLLKEWSSAAKAAGMRYGIAFHHEYTWWWWQSAFRSDITGTKAGIPYDGNLTLADGKGKWWEGYDPRLLYGVNLREYKGWDQDGWAPASGILLNHLEYCRWYATRWSLRIIDAINKYDPDFIYTDGVLPHPFYGEGAESGYKCDAMARVIADYYNHGIEKHGKVDTFSIVKFHPPSPGVVTTFEDNWPEGIKTDQPWIGETANGDWFYAPGFVNDPGALIRHMLECVSRDGSFCVNIAMLPDGSLDESTTQMLKDIGAWMVTNGEAIYGSKAWLKYGESLGTRIKSLPAGKLGQAQADTAFDAGDFRFTVGKDGSLYAICMTIPKPGTELKVKALGANSHRLTSKIVSVELLGSQEKLAWKQNYDALSLTYPSQMSLKIAAVFKVKLQSPLIGPIVVNPDAVSVETAPDGSRPTIRIKAGAEQEFTDSVGVEWDEDRGFDGGSVADRSDINITGTKTPELYKSEHYAMNFYTFKLPNGKYVVKLHFSEDYAGFSNKMDRLFTYTIKDGSVKSDKIVKQVKDFSPWNAAGEHFKAYIDSVPVSITACQITIQFLPQRDNPQINAIEIIPN